MVQLLIMCHNQSLSLHINDSNHRSMTLFSSSPILPSVGHTGWLQHHVAKDDVVAKIDISQPQHLSLAVGFDLHTGCYGNSFIKRFYRYGNTELDILLAIKLCFVLSTRHKPDTAEQSKQLSTNNPSVSCLIEQRWQSGGTISKPL